MIGKQGRKRLRQLRTAALTAAVSLLVTTAAGAAEPTVRLANILADNMVLQRNRPVRIWGWRSGR